MARSTQNSRNWRERAAPENAGEVAMRRIWASISALPITSLYVSDTTLTTVERL